MKRLICLLLALLLPCAALAEYSMAGYDPENVYRNWESNLFLKRMEEKTGVKFTYRQYGKEDEWTAAKAAMSAGSDDLPDVLFKARLSPDECMDMLDRGVLVDLKPYLEQDCPNLYAILQAHPEYWDAITLPDGRIAALPAISEQPMQNSVWLNKSWMDTLKLSMPTTIDELTDVLRAFRDQDPNRNGKKDEIPLAFIGSFDLKFLGHAFGLIANDYNIRAVDGQVEFVPLNENFRPFIEWLRLLYTEGLIDKDGFATSDTLRQVTDSNKTNIYGGVITTMTTTFLPAAWSSQYAVMRRNRVPRLCRRGDNRHLRQHHALRGCARPAAMGGSVLHRGSAYPGQRGRGEYRLYRRSRRHLAHDRVGQEQHLLYQRNADYLRHCRARPFLRRFPAPLQRFHRALYLRAAGRGKRKRAAALPVLLAHQGAAGGNRPAAGRHRPPGG